MEIERELFEAVAADIRADALHFDMDVYWKVAPDFFPATVAELKTGCGTVSCMLGRGVLLSNKLDHFKLFRNAHRTALFFKDKDENEEGAKLFGISNREASVLFHRRNWPEQYFNLGESPEQQAAAAVEIIERVLAENSAAWLVEEREDRDEY